MHAASGAPTDQGDNGDSQYCFVFLPGAPVFPPLVANPQEPRTGLRKEIGSSRLKLDIGAAIDLLEYAKSDRSATFRFGIDFFTYAMTTSAQGLRLQVDAVDGFFGGHLVYRTATARSANTVRLRILHLSAHFVDGHLVDGGTAWRDGRGPIPFTKDFGELIGAHECPLGPLGVSAYAGFGYATLIRPDSLRRYSGLGGIELHSTEIVGPVFTRPCNLFAAFNFTLTGIPQYRGSSCAMFGVKFGDWSGSGVKFYASYYSGLEVFSEYFDLFRSYWGIGFTFDVL
jgi:hypothetical protein